MTLKCPNGHLFEAENAYEPCPRCYALGQSHMPEPEDNFVQSTVMEDLAASSLLSESSVVESASSSVPDSTGFEGFSGGDSGGGGASDSFDSGSSDTGTCDASSGSD